MSLLIKALDKAQNAKTEEAQTQKAKIEAKAQSLERAAKTEQVQAEKAKSERTSAKQKQAVSDKFIGNAADMQLSLAPTTETIDEAKVIDEPGLANTLLTGSGVVKTNTTLAASPKQAANVFTAKGKEVSSGNKNLAIIAGLALFALLGMGAYFYRFINTMPEVVIPVRTIAAQPMLPSPLTESLPMQVTSAQTAENQFSASAKPLMSVSDQPTVFSRAQVAEKLDATHKKTTRKHIAPNDLALGDDEASANADANVQSGRDINEPATSTKVSKKTSKSNMMQSGEAIASRSASINVTKSKSQPSVNPILMSAYDAYNAGKDSEAQKLYKQVLQQDIYNVDALLGMGAIAQRQGRAADANGWYAKVLEVEPRNNIAQAALIDSQPQGNELSKETHLKNMLAKQPDDANLHVALGNLYAEQNHWPAAQQAYFDAYRLHPSVDNAFNLAVSLDQMGKPKLALPYYQRALMLAQTGSNGIDKAALEARIAAIQ